MPYGKGQKASIEISMYPVTFRQMLFKTVSLKGCMEIFMYPVTLRIIQKCFYVSVYGNFHVSCNIKNNSKVFLPKGSMETSMYPVTLRIIKKCFYLKGPSKFPCILWHWE